MTRSIYIVAGPNGAGKTTFAREFLPKYANCKNFINADLIAEGVSPFSPEQAAFRAGRLVLKEIESYIKRGVSFGFETTLAGQTYLNLIRDAKKLGFDVHIYFLWIPNVSVSLLRVRLRVSQGGHGVPEIALRRRFDRSNRNFMVRYRRLADSWMLFDNSGTTPEIIAFEKERELTIIDQNLYRALDSVHQTR